MCNHGSWHDFDVDEVIVGVYGEQYEDRSGIAKLGFILSKLL